MSAINPGLAASISQWQQLKEQSQQTSMQLVDVFLRITALQFGISDKITLVVLDQPIGFTCNPIQRIVYVPSEKIKNYGSGAETSTTTLLDCLPNNSFELINYLMASKKCKELFLQNFTEDLSDEEVEYALTHEIGHIFFQHQCTVHTPTHVLKTHEHQADSCAFLTARGRIGAARNYKRRILTDFLFQDTVSFIIHRQLRQVQSTHPSDELRLNQVHAVESAANSQSTSPMELGL